MVSSAESGRERSNRSIIRVSAMAQLRPAKAQSHDDAASQPITPADVTAALGGDRQAMAALVAAARPAVQTEVALALGRWGVARTRDPAQDGRDLLQDVFMWLLANDGAVLRRWDPTRGLGFAAFVGFVGRRHIIDRLRSRGANTRERSEPPDVLESHAGTVPPPEPQIAARRRLDRLLDELRRRVDTRSMQLFDLVYLRDLPVDEVCASVGMTRDAVYAWRSRFKHTIRSVAEAERAHDARVHGGALAESRATEDS